MHIPLSHFCKYPGLTTEKHTTFANQGRDIYKSVINGYNQLFFAVSLFHLLPIINYSPHSLTSITLTRTNPNSHKFSIVTNVSHWQKFNELIQNVFFLFSQSDANYHDFYNNKKARGRAQCTQIGQSTFLSSVYISQVLSVPKFVLKKIFCEKRKLCVIRCPRNFTNCTVAQVQA